MQLRYLLEKREEPVGVGSHRRPGKNSDSRSVCTELREDLKTIVSNAPTVVDSGPPIRELHQRVATLEATIQSLDAGTDASRILEHEDAIATMRRTILKTIINASSGRSSPFCRFREHAETKGFSASVVAVLDESPACVEVQELTLPVSEEETLVSRLLKKETRTRFIVARKVEEPGHTEKDHAMAPKEQVPRMIRSSPKSPSILRQFSNLALVAVSSDVKNRTIRPQSHNVKDCRDDDHQNNSLSTMTFMDNIVQDDDFSFEFDSLSDEEDDIYDTANSVFTDAQDVTSISTGAGCYFVMSKDEVGYTVEAILFPLEILIRKLEAGLIGLKQRTESGLEKKYAELQELTDQSICATRQRCRALREAAMLEMQERRQKLESISLSDVMEKWKELRCGVQAQEKELYRIVSRELAYTFTRQVSLDAHSSAYVPRFSRKPRSSPRRKKKSVESSQRRRPRSGRRSWRNSS